MRRLLDASIWIAFYRIGELDLLLRLPGLCITPRGLRELQDPRDDLACTVHHLADKTIAEAEADQLVETLALTLQARDRRLSEADAFEIAIARNRWEDTVLYMRDWAAEIAGALVGAPIRTHQQLVEEMEQLGLLGEEGRADLMQRLDQEYERSRRRRRSPRGRGRQR